MGRMGVQDGCSAGRLPALGHHYPSTCLSTTVAYVSPGLQVGRWSLKGAMTVARLTAKGAGSPREILAPSVMGNTE